MSRTVASRKTLNAKNLQTLGAGRLAELLIEISAGDAVAKRRLRLELAGRESPGAVAAEVRKRLASIGRSRSFVERRRASALAKDLNTQRHAIAGPISTGDPAEGLDTMWRFLSLSNPVFDRCDDSDGAVADVFEKAVEDLARIAEAAQPEPAAFADRVLKAVVDNEYGQYDALIPLLVPILGRSGLERLRQRVTSLSEEPAPKPEGSDRIIVGYGLNGPLYADEIEESSRNRKFQAALMDIADAQGDADAFIAQYDETERRVPGIAADIGRRLLKADRAAEALEVIDAADTERGRGFRSGFDWDDARIDVLEALGRPEDAQQHRWACFECFLSAAHLKAYLKRASDFDAIGAEEQALHHAQRFTNPYGALTFLISWPDLDGAAKFVSARVDELSGSYYEHLVPAAEALAGRHPLAATLLLRVMIDFALEKGRSKRYTHAARHLGECANLAHGIEDFSPVETHADYESRLRREHGRKRAFWDLTA